MSRANCHRGLAAGLALSLFLAFPGCRAGRTAEPEPVPEAAPEANEPEEEIEIVAGLDVPVLSDQAAQTPNTVIGIGGGAGGSYGGRFGGRRRMRSYGGAAREETEGYAPIEEGGYRLTRIEPLSTFSVDVDTAAYANVRRFLERGEQPPVDAVRIEELLNYFRYDDPYPLGPDPFSVAVEIAGCPWNSDHRLARIGLRTLAIQAFDRPPCNLVFLIDVSGSMSAPQKLDLVKRGLKLLVENLGARDTVAIAVYAGASGLVLPPTSALQGDTILRALEQLKAGGSTNGGEGLRLAYGTARAAYVQGGVNRVVLATDGDFNVGVTDPDELVDLVRAEAAGGIALSVLGFGMGNLQDGRLEQLADDGDGNYAYVDGIAEARKVLVEEMGATLVTVAEDVKLQVSFDPARVAAFRLIGYENRVLEHEDFTDDTKDAGEIGAGHGVTALFELVPHGVALDGLGFDEEPVRDGPYGGQLMTVAVRYQDPGGSASRLSEVPGVDHGAMDTQTSDDFRFAAAVASFGMLLRGSPSRGSATYASTRALAAGALGRDAGGHRAAFLALVDAAASLQEEAAGQ